MDNPCFICGELFDELDLEPSPSGSGKKLCAGCWQDVDDDLFAMHFEDDGDENAS